MFDGQTCSKCGAPLPRKFLQGLCPRCVIKHLQVDEADRASPLPQDGESEAAWAAPQAEPATRLVPARRFGDYELLEEIARGGMGMVYRARQISLDRLVAVKVILAGPMASAEFKQRFQVEARAAAHLHHPNLVAVHEVGEEDGFQYYSMDIIEGRSLADVVRDKPLSPRQAAVYCRIIADAIQHAHEHGVLHRDLKPSNILIDEHDQPHVTDFGLAKLMTGESELTITGAVLGSPSYLPPEQAVGTPGSGTPASDVYSLGAVLYHLVTGRPPFLANTAQETLSQVTNKDPVSLRWLNPAVPRDLETIGLKCLEKSPGSRYQTARELAQELDRFISGRPILARPVSRPEKLVRWSRREPALASLMAATLILLLVGTSLVAWEWRRAERHAAVNRRLLYVRAMKSAFAEWFEGSPAQAKQLLRTQRPQAGEPDLRGFEWRHLWWLTHADCLLSLPSRSQVAGGLCFSPNGSLVAAYYWNNRIRLWDLNSPRREITTLTNACCLGAFLDGGQSYIFGTQDGSVIVCSSQTGQIMRSLPQVGELAAVSADGRFGVVIEPNGGPKVVELGNGRLVLSIPVKCHRRSDYGWGALITMSLNGGLLAVVEPPQTPGKTDTRIRLWNTQTGVELASFADDRPIYSLAFSPDRRLLAVGGEDGVVNVWELETGLGWCLQGHEMPILALAFSLDGAVLATGSRDERIQLWDLATRTQKADRCRGFWGPVYSLAFSPDGSKLAAGSRDAGVSLLSTGEDPAMGCIEGISAGGWGTFAFSPDSRLIVAACTNDSVTVWESRSFKLATTLPGAGRVIGFSRDANELLAFSPTQKPRWWNLATGAMREMPAHDADFAQVTSLDLSPNRKIAAFGFDDGRFRLVDVNSGLTLAAWNTARAPRADRTAFQDAILSVAFSPGGDKLLTAGRDRVVVIWDVATQRELASNSEHKGAVCALAFSRDGSWIASGCGAGTIKLYHAYDIEASLASISPHHARIVALDFSPEGTTLASGSQDETVRFWNIFAPQQDMARLDQHSPVRCLRFSPDGNNLAVVTADGKLRMLRAVSLAEADRQAALDR